MNSVQQKIKHKFMYTKFCNKKANDTFLGTGKFKKISLYFMNLTFNYAIVKKSMTAKNNRKQIHTEILKNRNITAENIIVLLYLYLF